MSASFNNHDNFGSTRAASADSPLPERPSADPAQPETGSADDASPEIPGVRRATLVASRRENAEVCRLDLEIQGGWSHRPGQVAELSVGPGREGFFAVASAPHDAPHLVFLVKAGGTVSEPLMALKPGDSIDVRGPLGHGYDLADDAPAADRPALLLIGVGTALGALRSALLHALQTSSPRRITLLVGFRNRREMCFADEIDTWRQWGVNVHIAATRDDGSWTGLAGRIQDHLAAVVAEASVDGVPLCLIAGSEPFEDDMTERLTAAGVPIDAIQRNFRPDARTRDHALNGKRPRQESNL